MYFITIFICAHLLVYETSLLERNSQGVRGEWLFFLWQRNAPRGEHQKMIFFCGKCLQIFIVCTYLWMYNNCTYVTYFTYLLSTCMYGQMPRYVNRSLGATREIWPQKKAFCQIVIQIITQFIDILNMYICM